MKSLRLRIMRSISRERMMSGYLNRPIQPDEASWHDKVGPYPHRGHWQMRMDSSTATMFRSSSPATPREV
jgi:hypothetical protein